MTTTTPVDLDDLEPMARSEAVELGQVMYERLVDALDGLDDDDWSRATDCTLWTVRDVAGHVAGMMATSHGLRRLVTEQVRVARRARRTGEEPIDAMTAMQKESVAALSPEELVATMRSRIEGAVRGRGRVPSALARTLRFPQVVNGRKEMWTIDYLLGVIITRDSWLHRVADVARAVGAEPILDVHDRRIVADAAAEWARRHGQPVELTLTGSAGGTFRSGHGGPSIETDAITFCRILSGRAEPTHPLFTTQVPF